MQKCSYCGADLPANSRFCGKCGSMQAAIATDAAATMSNTPQPQTWAPESGTLPATWPPPAQGSAPTWSPNIQVPETPPPPPTTENEDERRRGIPPWSPLYSATLGADALLSSGQAYPPGAPVVQGTPQFGSVPSVSGSPTPYTNAPVSHPVQGPANAPISHPAQGSANAPYPQTGPQPTHYPPQPPGTQEHHPPHKHHEHRTHRTQHTGHVTKAAGGSSIKTIILVVTTVVVVAAVGIGAAAYFLSRPQPLISITSNYKVGNALAGANGTILHISGKKFSSSSAITFLLDDRTAPGNPGTRSDSNGTFSADVTITNAWSVGTHILTARDASNYNTKNSVSVTIVKPGQANTPGPFGAPPDNASFRVNATLHYVSLGKQLSQTEIEVVTGHPDPAGGTDCQTEDNGQPHIYSSVTADTGTPYQQTATFSCTGTYKGGKLTLTETVISDIVVFTSSNPLTTCTLNTPHVDEQLIGSYTDQHLFSGTVNYPEVPTSAFPCNTTGSSFYYIPGQGTWTGQIVGS